MRICYSITCLHRDGERQLCMPSLQAVHCWGRRADAEAWLAAAAQEGALARLAHIYGPQSSRTFRVDAFECDQHGDPIGWWPIEPPRMAARPSEGRASKGENNE